MIQHTTPDNVYKPTTRLPAPDIYRFNCPTENKAQGSAMRLLFVCATGMLRSATCQTVANQFGYNARACGVSNIALIPLSANLIMWAEKIVFMESQHYQRAVFDFYDFNQELTSKSVIWEFEDIYEYMCPMLIRKIEDSILSLAQIRSGLH